MIFICIGSRDYQFNRLLIKVDELIEQNEITDEVIAQIGQSTYVPKHYQWHRYLDSYKFKELQNHASLIISHAGTGSLISALKLGKQVIAVPRLAKYGEHIDDHQLQISGILSAEGYLKEVIELDDLANEILQLKKNPIMKKWDKPSNIINIINNYLGKQQAK